MGEQNETANGGATIVLVGHCGPDMFMLKSAIGRAVPGAAITQVNDTKALENHLAAGHVLLVNRELDGQFATGSGIELIRDLTQREVAAVSMLISNYADAQAQAVEAGAHPGFGKSEMYEASTKERLQAAAAAG